MKVFKEMKVDKERKTQVYEINEWDLQDLAEEESKFGKARHIARELYSNYNDNKKVAELLSLIKKLEIDSADNAESLIRLYSIGETLELLKDIL